MRRKAHAIIAGLSYLLLNACGDPGYRFRPVGWQPIPDKKWMKQFADFEIQTRGIRGLNIDSSVRPELHIYNNTKLISVETASLLTATEKFPAEIYRSEPIPPSTHEYHFPIKWEFDDNRSAPKVLGDHCTIILVLKVGGERREIRIEYEKY